VADLVRLVFGCLRLIAACPDLVTGALDRATERLHLVAGWAHRAEACSRHVASQSPLVSA
jgi:hypothetical protein